MDGSSQNSEKNWLVRSSTRVLGPYTLDEVTKLLASRQISIIDEVRQPSVRWSYIRENRLFLELIKDLRQAQDNAVENTMTMTATLSNQTTTKTDGGNDDLTPTPVFAVEKPSRTTAGGGFKDLIDVTEVSAKPSSSSHRVFGTLQDERIRQRIEKRAQHLKVVITSVALVILVVLGFLFMNKGRKQVTDYEDLTTLVLKYKNIGLYDKALDAYKRIQVNREPDFELQYQMAPLLISEDRQSLLGRRILQKALLSDGRSREDLLDSNIGIALTYMQEGDWQEAETFLQKAMTYEPNNATAQTNLAIIQFRKNNFISAATQLDALAKRAPRSNMLLTLRVMSWIDASHLKVDSNVLRSLYATIKSSVSKPTYLGQELSLLSIRIAQLLKDSNLENEAIHNFMNQVPSKSSQYLRSLMVDGRMLQWDYLIKYCTDAFDGKKLSSLEKGALAICLMEVNRDEDANRHITEALSEAPHNPNLLAIQASYLMKVSRSSEAMTLLKIPELRNLSLTQQLTGTLCMQLDKVDCAKAAYKAVYDKDQENVYALYGLAWANLQESQRNQAYEYMKAGLQIEPGYLPLIDLRDRLDSQ